MSILGLKRKLDKCNLSPNYLIPIKKATGKTFIEYVNMLRFHEADQLLREEKITVIAAALKIGFTNLTSFGRVFKLKQFKTLRPSDVVKEARKQDWGYFKRE
ncbi:MAG: helix-turn-helix domain-containing protein [Bacillota bacterium]